MLPKKGPVFRRESPESDKSSRADSSRTPYPGEPPEYKGGCGPALQDAADFGKNAGMLSALREADEEKSASGLFRGGSRESNPLLIFDLHRFAPGAKRELREPSSPQRKVTPLPGKLLLPVHAESG